MAGLAAAGELSSAGTRVLLLEARNRLGGRIHTIQDPHTGIAIELGAEFVHGRAPEIFGVVSENSLRAIEMEGDEWCLSGGTLRPCDFFGEVEALLSRMDAGTPDQSFASYLRSQWASEEAKRWATGYIEGFHAANADEVSIHSIVKGDRADEEIDGERQFRIAGGYGVLVEALYNRVDQERTDVRLSTEVRAVHWRDGDVIAYVSLGEAIRARCLLITVPLAVLQASAVTFLPPLTSKQDPLSMLGMGGVMRVTLVLRERLWESASSELREMSFLFSQHETFPTLWTLWPNPAPVITAWAPPRSAQRLAGTPAESIRREAVQALAGMLRLDVNGVDEAVVACYTYDWVSDPFSRGAYSWVKVGGGDAEKRLAEPVANTLFFAGEATNYEGHNGTVHGAIATGWRAAKEILRVLR